MLAEEDGYAEISELPPEVLKAIEQVSYLLLLPTKLLVNYGS